LKVAFKEGAGVLEVLGGVGLGGGQTGKRFVQQPHNPLLLRKRGIWNLDRLRGTNVEISDSTSCCKSVKLRKNNVRT
jgi:hypothetical protein